MTDTTKLTACREAFEKWYIQQYGHAINTVISSGTKAQIECMWQGFQEAWNTRTNTGLDNAKAEVVRLRIPKDWHVLWLGTDNSGDIICQMRYHGETLPFESNKSIFISRGGLTAIEALQNCLEVLNQRENSHDR